MAKISVTYRAPKDDSKVVEMGGHTFFDGKVEKVDSDAEGRLLGKLRNNPFFEVGDKDASKVDAPKQTPTSCVTSGMRISLPSACRSAMRTMTDVLSAPM
jgi:hypothetical protein